MNYVNKILVDGEKLKYSGRLHWIFLAKRIAGIIIILAFSLFNPLLLTFMPIVALSMYPYWKMIHLTDRRLIFKRGLTITRVLRARDLQEILSNKVKGVNISQGRYGTVWFKGMYPIDEIALPVEGVNISQSLLGRLLDYGTIRVLHIPGGEISLFDVDSPFILKKALDEVITA